jgi:hypothetical protein
MIAAAAGGQAASVSITIPVDIATAGEEEEG